MRFLLVDEIQNLVPGASVQASKRLPASEELFRDHFPGFPVVPGVLLVEMMGQAAGKCLDADGTHPGRAMLGKIHSANFRDWVRPDEEITLRAEIKQNRPQFAVAVCSVEVLGRKVADAELFFVFAPRENFAADAPDPVLAAYYQSRAGLASGAADSEEAG
jgi:3-hydroxyacyl-[acyl-carrier-protein] dehydratase